MFCVTFGHLGVYNGPWTGTTTDLEQYKIKKSRFFPYLGTIKMAMKWKAEPNCSTLSYLTFLILFSVYSNSHTTRTIPTHTYTQSHTHIHKQYNNDPRPVLQGLTMNRTCNNDGAVVLRDVWLCGKKLYEKGTKLPSKMQMRKSYDPSNLDDLIIINTIIFIVFFFFNFVSSFDCTNNNRSALRMCQ